MSFRPLGARTVGRGRIFDHHRLHLLAPDGTAIARDVVRHRGAVGILPVWGREVTLIRQFRAAFGKEIWEIPAGRIEPDDRSPEEAARRELWEETGLRAERITDLGEILPSPGYTDERIRILVAEGLTQGRRSPDGVEEGVARLARIGIDDALAMIESGVICDAKTLVALLRWAAWREG